jgi:hypothetical protein
MDGAAPHTPLAAASGSFFDGDDAPDRRYRVASRLAREGRVPLPTQFDAPTRELTAYLLVEMACATDRERLDLAARHPAVAGALALRRAAARTLAERIEALILARQSVSAISRDTRLAPAVVERYRAYFFSLGDRINDVGYVLDRVVGPITWAPSDRAAARRRVTRLVAYRCGRAALDALPWTGRVPSGERWVRADDLVSDLAFEDQILALVSSAAPPGTMDPRRLESLLAALTKKISSGPLADTPTHILH